MEKIVNFIFQKYYNKNPHCSKSIHSENVSPVPVDHQRMQKQNVNFFPKPILEEISPRVENPISGDRKLSTSNSLLPSSVLDHSCKNNIENKTIQDQILKGEDLKNEIGRLERGKE